MATDAAFRLDEFLAALFVAAGELAFEVFVFGAGEVFGQKVVFVIFEEHRRHSAALIDGDGIFQIFGELDGVHLRAHAFEGRAVLAVTGEASDRFKEILAGLDAVGLGLAGLRGAAWIFEGRQIGRDVAAVLIVFQERGHDGGGAKVAGVFKPLVNPLGVGARADMGKIGAGTANNFGIAFVAGGAVELFDPVAALLDAIVLIDLRKGGGLVPEHAGRDGLLDEIGRLPEELKTGLAGLAGKLDSEGVIAGFDGDVFAADFLIVEKDFGLAGACAVGGEGVFAFFEDLDDAFPFGGEGALEGGMDGVVVSEREVGVGGDEADVVLVVGESGDESRRQCVSGQCGFGCEKNCRPSQGGQSRATSILTHPSLLLIELTHFSTAGRGAC